MDPRQAEALRAVEEMGELQKLVDLANNAEAQLRDDWSPLLAVLTRAQDDAASAMLGLATTKADRPDVIRELQHRVWRFGALVHWLREIVAEGDEAQKAIAKHRSEYLHQLVALDELDDDTRRALGLPETQAPSE